MAIPIALAFAGAAIDLSRYHAERDRLQDFADSLALKGARELPLSSVTDRDISNSVSAAARGLARDTALGEFQISVAVDKQAASVKIFLTKSAPRSLMLANLAPYNQTIRVEAEAVARGGENVCVVALKPDGESLKTQQFAHISARACAVLSNSSAKTAIVATDKSLLEADLICSAGGFEGDANRFSPKSPMTDCPVYEDPLAERAPPPVGACTEFDYEVGFLNSTPGQGSAPLITTRLSPGVYCGGLQIHDLARVEFDPGVYVIKDGPLLVGKNSDLVGDGVGFFLTGDAATFTFEKNATVDLTAPRDGPMAGILFFEDRNAPLERNHTIYSEDARRLLGTFYLPRGALVIDTQKPVADQSAYTAIVARRLELLGKPTLVINADYSLTDVPVPSGLGPVGADVYLRE
ncbi:MAG: Tad domain-containing protein [Parvularculaceae bacterium]|nr:Tad domain-containing protein [Parvularculaceae bacterium]